MPTTQETMRIATAIQALRPEWPYQSLVTFITRDYANIAAQDLAVMLTVAALTPEAQTPSVIKQPGPWRDAVKRVTNGPTYTPEAICPDHPTHPLLRCPECLRWCSEHVGRRRDGCLDCQAAEKRRADTVRAGVELVRQAIRKAGVTVHPDDPPMTKETR